MPSLFCVAYFLGSDLFVPHQIISLITSIFIIRSQPNQLEIIKALLVIMLKIC